MPALVNFTNFRVALHVLAQVSFGKCRSLLGHGWPAPVHKTDTLHIRKRGSQEDKIVILTHSTYCRYCARELGRAR